MWLLVPEDKEGRLDVGFEFTLQEGGRLVGHGRVLAVLNPALQAGAA